MRRAGPAAAKIPPRGKIPPPPERRNRNLRKAFLFGPARASQPGMMLDRMGMALERYMDLLSTRQKLVAGNLANADTPGYKTKDLAFRSEFDELVRGGDPEAVEVAGLKVRNDGNNVSVDREARLLAENALRFNMAATLLRGQLRTLRSAIQEGRNG
jgi:flagellar basal-body rod protein FlgB